LGRAEPPSSNGALAEYKIALRRTHSGLFSVAGRVHIEIGSGIETEGAGSISNGAPAEERDSRSPSIAPHLPSDLREAVSGLRTGRESTRSTNPGARAVDADCQHGPSRSLSVEFGTTSVISSANDRRRHHCRCKLGTAAFRCRIAVFAGSVSMGDQVVLAYATRPPGRT
jgi:hypothetical protein